MKNRIINDKGRLFGKISVIDIIVLILAVILVFAVYTRASQNEAAKKTDSLSTVRYSMKIDEVRQGTVDAMKAGDKIYNQDNGTCIGTITNVSAGPATKAAQKTDGTYVNGTVQDRYDITLSIEADCRISDGRVYADRTDELNVNAEKKAYSKYVRFTGTITEMEE